MAADYPAEEQTMTGLPEFESLGPTPPLISPAILDRCRDFGFSNREQLRARILEKIGILEKEGQRHEFDRIPRRKVGYQHLDVAPRCYSGYFVRWWCVPAFQVRSGPVYHARMQLNRLSVHFVAMLLRWTERSEKSVRLPAGLKVPLGGWLGRKKESDSLTGIQAFLASPEGSQPIATVPSFGKHQRFGILATWKTVILLAVVDPVRAEPQNGDRLPVRVVSVEGYWEPRFSLVRLWTFMRTGTIQGGLLNESQNA